MRKIGTVRLLVWIIAITAALAAGTGVLSRGGPGPYEIQSVRGETVLIWGRGLYRHMSAEVAPQGIAQDVVTLLLAIPLLLYASRRAAWRSVRGRLLLAGTLAYFFVTYLLYLMMGTYNAMFLPWTILLATSFLALAMVLMSVQPGRLRGAFGEHAPVRGAAIFLLLAVAMIGMLWLSIVVPPLLSGEVVPRQVEHFTTLVVQGLDLGLLLPLGAVSGWLLLKRRPLGFLLAPTYLVFLAILMTALSAKVVAMGVLGYNVVPAILLIPALNAAAIVFAVRVIRAAAPSHIGTASRERVDSGAAYAET